MPEKFLNAPELYQGLELFLVAFWDLDSERSLGFSAGPIPRSAIAQWADEYELDRDQREDLFFHIKMLDSAIAEWRSAKRQRDQAAAKAEPAPKPRRK